jgi:response regulator NasT
MTEPDAFRWIQKTSMDRRLTMRKVAEAVIEGSADPSGTDKDGKGGDQPTDTSDDQPAE